MEIIVAQFIEQQIFNSLRNTRIRLLDVFYEIHGSVGQNEDILNKAKQKLCFRSPA